ncbi:MAG: hypothetical protein ACRDUT_00055 [Mycobacterium sp.]
MADTYAEVKFEGGPENGVAEKLRTPLPQELTISNYVYTLQPGTSSPRIYKSQGPLQAPTSSGPPPTAHGPWDQAWLGFSHALGRRLPAALHNASQAQQAALRRLGR